MELKQEQYEAEVVEDARTGEIIPRGAPPELKPGILAQININQVGTLEVGEEELKVLQEPLDPKDVQIRPDGLVYLPWTWYANRLNRAFGILKWGLIPQGSPMIKDMGNNTLIVWLNWLVIKGVPVSMAGGETSYQPSNYTMSYGDAVEGARANSLARNCKMLGMSLDLWNPEWVSGWKEQYAESYKNEKNKTLWRKKKVNGNKPQVVKPEAFDLSKVPVPEDVKPVVFEEKTEVVYEDLTSWSELSKIPSVKDIAAQAGVKNSDVAKYLGTLDKSGAYSVSEIVKEVKKGATNGAK